MVKFVERDAYKEEKGEEEAGLEEALRGDEIGLAEILLLMDGDDERRDGKAEELAKGPEKGEGDEEEADEPGRIEVAEVLGGSESLEAEMEDEREGEEGEKEEDNEKREGCEIA